VLSLFAVVGMTLRQLPGFAFRSPTDYANEMDRIHSIYDAALGTAVVDALERLQVWHVFSSTWFSIGLVVLIISIVACTIDRTPRLWRQSADVRVVQPDPFFDPTLPDRALMAGVAAPDVATVLRRHRFKVRSEVANGATYVYGDRNRWTKLATLVTHTGLVLFLLAAAVTSRLGDEQGLVVAEGESLTVQPIGTPGLLLVRNLGFDAPGFAETGRASDFTTDLAVYQNGQEVARKTIRVNDPLTVGGYTFHQNGFGPAPDVVIRDTSGRPLWSGPIPMTDSAAGLPFAEFAVPGRDIALQMVLQRQTDGTGVLLVLPFRAVGTNDDGTPRIAGLEPLALVRGESDTAAGTDFSVELRGFQDFTLLIAKRDPGQGLVWIAAVCLVVGLLITFWLPRRRVWAKVGPDGRLALTVRADRYVDVTREFGAVLEDLVKVRRGRPSAPSSGSSSAASSAPSSAAAASPTSSPGAASSAADR
jgi:cytochrome c biogenesis protein